MLKGAEKRMIVIRTRESRVFEEAYFVLRRDAPRVEGEADMLREANRILESSHSGSFPRSLPPSPPLSFGLLRGLVWFGLGLLTGSGAVGLLWVLL
jgi:hypothetical protein